MQQTLLILNSGSSSLKFSLYVAAPGPLSNRPILYGQIEALDEQPYFIVKDAQNALLVEEHLTVSAQPDRHALALDYLLNWLNKNCPHYLLVAAGHRVVHGADRFYQPVIINEEILAVLESFNVLAPLHQPYNIAGIRALRKTSPNILQIACFDTAFHFTHTAVAQAFAVPANLSPYPIKRYGFHGLSYEYIAQVLPDYLGEEAEKKIIVAHLGHGASLCALENRQSIATTMGFTALDGLPMGTRCGNLDPGVVLYLLEQQKMSVAEVVELLYQKSGLLGVSGISADVRKLLASQNPQAKFAIDLLVYRITREIGSLLAALGGLNSIIFTAGIGEHAASIRADVCQNLAWLGLKLNAEANSQNRACISTGDSCISVWAIPTNEEFIIAQYTWRFWQNAVK